MGTAAASIAAADAPDVNAAEEGSYAVWTSDGRRTTLQRAVEACRGADVVMLGEEHDDDVAHAAGASTSVPTLGDSGSSK